MFGLEILGLVFVLFIIVMTTIFILKHKFFNCILYDPEMVGNELSQNTLVKMLKSLGSNTFFKLRNKNDNTIISTSFFYKRQKDGRCTP